MYEFELYVNYMVSRGPVNKTEQKTVNFASENGLLLASEVTTRRFII